jgi:anti-sigma B factor antagonist
MSEAWQSSAWVGVTDEPGTLILRICGRLDLVSRDVIETIILAAIANIGAVVLDLAALTFCDSSGIGMFVRANERADESGCTLTFTNLRPVVQRTFALSGIDRVVQLVD